MEYQNNFKSAVSPQTIAELDMQGYDAGGIADDIPPPSSTRSQSPQAKDQKSFQIPDAWSPDIPGCGD